MRLKATLLGSLAALFMIAPAPAAEMRVVQLGVQDGLPVYALMLQGEIFEGDDRRFETLIDHAERNNRAPGILMLNSPGGATFESISIAKWVNSIGVPVFLRAAQCDSGCSIVALAARRGRLFIEGGSRIGLHQSWEGSPDVPSAEGTQAVADALRSFSTPETIIDKMWRTRSDSISYLTRPELAEIGAHVK